MKSSNGTILLPKDNNSTPLENLQLTILTIDYIL